MEGREIFHALSRLQTLASGREKGRKGNIPCPEPPSDGCSGRGKRKEVKYSMLRGAFRRWHRAGKMEEKEIFHAPSRFQTVAPGGKNGRKGNIPCPEAPSDVGSGRGKWKERGYSMPRGAFRRWLWAGKMERQEVPPASPLRDTSPDSPATSGRTDSPATSCRTDSPARSGRTD